MASECILSLLINSVRYGSEYHHRENSCFCSCYIALILVNFVTPNFFLIFSILLHCLPTQSINTESLLKAIYLCKLFSTLRRRKIHKQHTIINCNSHTRYTQKEQTNIIYSLPRHTTQDHYLADTRGPYN